MLQVVDIWSSWNSTTNEDALGFQEEKIIFRTKKQESRTTLEEQIYRCFRHTGILKGVCSTERLSITVFGETKETTIA